MFHVKIWICVSMNVKHNVKINSLLTTKKIFIYFQHDTVVVPITVPEINDGWLHPSRFISSWGMEKWRYDIYSGGIGSCCLFAFSIRRFFNFKYPKTDISTMKTMIPIQHPTINPKRLVSNECIIPWLESPFSSVIKLGVVSNVLTSVHLDTEVSMSNFINPSVNAVLPSTWLNSFTNIFPS